MFISTKHLLLASCGFLAAAASPTSFKTNEPQNSTAFREVAPLPNAVRIPNAKGTTYRLDSITVDVDTVETAYLGAERVIVPHLNATTTPNDYHTMGDSLLHLYFEGERAKFDLKEHVAGVPTPSNKAEVDALTQNIRKILRVAKNVLNLLTVIEKYLPELHKLIEKHDGKRKLLLQYKVMFYQISKLGERAVKSEKLRPEQIDELYPAIEDGWHFFTMSRRVFGPRD